MDEDEARVGGFVYRVRGGSVSRRRRGRYVELSRGELLALPRDGDVWTWLRRHGITRPSPSGPTQPEHARERVQCLLRLRPADVARLDVLAERWGVTRSDAVVRLLDDVPRPLTEDEEREACEADARYDEMRDRDDAERRRNG